MNPVKPRSLWDIRDGEKRYPRRMRKWIIINKENIIMHCFISRVNKNESTEVINYGQKFGR